MDGRAAGRTLFALLAIGRRTSGLRAEIAAHGADTRADEVGGPSVATSCAIRFPVRTSRASAAVDGSTRSVVVGLGRSVSMESRTRSEHGKRISLELLGKARLTPPSILDQLHDSAFPLAQVRVGQVRWKESVLELALVSLLLQLGQES